MQGLLRTAAVVVALALAGAAVAHAEEGPTRAEYVAQVEPICEANTNASRHILDGANAHVQEGKLDRAARQFFHASEAFFDAIGELGAVPRPAADSERLLKWLKFLRIVGVDLRKIGKALKEDDKIKAIHERIRAERSANASNNVSFVFNFDKCRLRPSQFR